MSTDPYQTPTTPVSANTFASGQNPVGWKEVMFSFQGRIGRKTFWLSILAITVVAWVAIAIIMGIGANMETGEISPLALILLVLLYIPMIWISLALQAKRWHDRDKSAWWILLNLVPIINIWAFIETGFLKGTEGPNQFGPDPLAGV